MGAANHEPRCSDCRFWEPRGLGQGLCRKRPPVALLVPQEDGEAVAEAVWPKTDETDWCGAFEGEPSRFAIDPGKAGPARPLAAGAPG